MHAPMQGLRGAARCSSCCWSNNCIRAKASGMRCPMTLHRKGQPPPRRRAAAWLLLGAAGVLAGAVVTGRVGTAATADPRPRDDGGATSQPEEVAVLEKIVKEHAALLTRRSDRLLAATTEAPLRSL